VARDAAVKESEARIAELEKNVQDLRKLLDLRNRSMADMQRELESSRGAQAAVSGAVAGAATQAGAAKDQSTSAPAGTPATASTSGGSAAMPPSVAAPAASTSMSEAAGAKPEPVSPASPSADAAPAVAGAEAAADRSAQPSEGAVPVPPAAAGSKQPSASSEPVAQPGLIDDLLENPLLLPGLGGIAALGAGYALYAMRRRRKVEAFEDSLATSDTFASNSLFGSTGGQSVDIGRTGGGIPEAMKRWAKVIAHHQ
jgi:pilus assembly protein FimV